MTLAFFVRSLTHGGAEHVAAQLTALWSRQGHKVLVVSELPPTERDYPTCAMAREVVPMALLAAGRLAALHTQYRFDAAIFNDGFNSPHFPAVFDAIRSVPGMRTVLILHHSFMNWSFQLVCLREVTEGVRLLAPFDVVACVEPLSALWWRQAGVKAVCIQNPVSIKPRAACERSPSHDVVWIGRVMDSGKRIGLMLDAFVRVRTRISDARLVILGATDPSCERRLLHGLPDDVVRAVAFKGFVSDVADELAHAGVHVFTSVVEAAPQAVAEAQAAGVPSVVCDLPVLCLENEDSGVVRVSDEEGLVEAIVGLLGDPERQRRLGANALAAASRRVEAAEAETKWHRLLGSLSDCDALAAFEAEEGRMLDRPEIRDALFAELRRGHGYLAERYAPDCLWLRKWRQRLDVRYVVRRLREKFRSGTGKDTVIG